MRGLLTSVRQAVWKVNGKQEENGSYLCPAWFRFCSSCICHVKRGRVLQMNKNKCLTPHERVCIWPDLYSSRSGYLDA